MWDPVAVSELFILSQFLLVLSKTETDVYQTHSRAIATEGWGGRLNGKD